MSSIRYSEQDGKALLERMAKKTGARQPVGKPRVAPSVGEAVTAAASGPSLLELRLAQQIAEAGLPEPVREYFHVLNRDCRLDFAWPNLRLYGCRFYVEVQGSQHRVKGRFAADIEKRALGLMQDPPWIGLELDGKAIRSGEGIKWLCELLKRAKSPQAAPKPKETA